MSKLISYSTVCNGHMEIADVSHSEACQKFSEVFHSNDKHKYVALHQHIKDASGNILSSKIVLEVSGRPNLKAIRQMEASHAGAK